MGCPTTSGRAKCLKTLPRPKQDAQWSLVLSIWKDNCPKVCRTRADSPDIDIRGKHRHAETEGFLTYRIADCGGDHPDHRCHRYSELTAGAHRGQRVVWCCLYPNH